MIQMLRYAPRLKALGATVLFWPVKGMENLAARLRWRGSAKLGADDDDFRFDFYIHPLSLPRVF